MSILPDWNTQWERNEVQIKLKKTSVMSLNAGTSAQSECLMINKNWALESLLWPFGFRYSHTKFPKLLEIFFVWISEELQQQLEWAGPEGHIYPPQISPCFWGINHPVGKWISQTASLRYNLLTSHYCWFYFTPIYFPQGLHGHTTVDIDMSKELSISRYGECELQDTI